MNVCKMGKFVFAHFLNSLLFVTSIEATQTNRLQIKFLLLYVPRLRLSETHMRICGAHI